MTRIVKERKALLLKIGKRAARRYRMCGHFCSAPLRDQGGKCCDCRGKARLCPICSNRRRKR